MPGYPDAPAPYSAPLLAVLGRLRGSPCWAHAWRKFVEAEKTNAALAQEAVARIKTLYAVEQDAKHLDAPARAALRQRRSRQPRNTDHLLSANNLLK